jgi:transposase
MAAQTEPPTKEQMIIHLFLQQCSRDTISEILHVGHVRVSHVVRDWQSSGIIPEPARIGRKPKVNRAIRDYIEVRTLQEAGLAGRDLVDEIDERYKIHLSTDTVWLIRRQLNFKYRRARHVQILSPEHKQNRVAFCEQMLRPEQEPWLPKSCFSDECRIILGDDKQWVWYRAGEGNPSANCETRKFPSSLMIFAVIGMGFRSKILFVIGSIDATKYRENIEELGFIELMDEIHGPLNWIFQQDGASCHTAQVTVDWLGECCDVLADWPANSPDLNPIELLWAILKRAVRAVNPQTIDVLKRVITEAWARISQRSIDHLCQSFQKRLELCRDRQGDSISNDLWMLSHERALTFFGDVTDPGHWAAWTVREDKLLVQLQLIMGPRWKEMARSFPNRTANQLKNRWHHTVKHREHELLSQTELMMEKRKQAGEEHPQLDKIWSAKKEGRTLSVDVPRLPAFTTLVTH